MKNFIGRLEKKFQISDNKSYPYFYIENDLVYTKDSNVKLLLLSLSTAESAKKNKATWEASPETNVLEGKVAVGYYTEEEFYPAIWQRGQISMMMSWIYHKNFDKYAEIYVEFDQHLDAKGIHPKTPIEVPHHISRFIYDNWDKVYAYYRLKDNLIGSKSKRVKPRDWRANRKTYPKRKKEEMIIGISGKIGSGKDTAGEMICQLTSKRFFDASKYSPNLIKEFMLTGVLFMEKSVDTFEIRKYADKLKDMVCLLIGCSREELEDREFKEKELGEEWNCWLNNSKRLSSHSPRLSMSKPNDFFNHFGGVSYRKLTPRKILQILGTEAGRNLIHPNIWVNALFSDYKENNNWIITDVRFPNEAQAIKDRGGVIVRISRDLNEESSHESELALDNYQFDYIIANNGSLEDLNEKVKRFLGHTFDFSNGGIKIKQ